MKTYIEECWLKDWLPDIHIMFNGATGGWDAFCEVMVSHMGFESLKIKLVFNHFPTVEELNVEAIKEIRKRNGCN